MKFYVYEWYNTTTNDIFYVGKGCGKRIKSLSDRNRLFKDYIKNNNCDNRIIKEFDNENDAFAYEHERIMQLKSQGQAKCNLDYGGKGGCNFVWTKELKDYKSKFNPMKEQSQRERMKLNNPMKNKEIAARVNGQKGKHVIINGIEYNSIWQAAKELGVGHETIKVWCKKGVNPKFQPCKFKDQEQVCFKAQRYNMGSCRPLMYKDKYYESPIDLARELNLSSSTISKWALKGYDTNGNKCQYIDDTATHVYKGHIHHGKLVKVNGIIYPSIAEAQRQLGLTKARLAPYFKKIRKNNDFICEYVNQQPSTNLND